MKKWNVNYAVTVSHDATIKAETKEEAIRKIEEVIGEDVVIESVWEVK